MTEQDRINKDFEHFKATGDDYPHCQRAHDKSMADRLAFASLWCFAVAFSLACWLVIWSFL